MDLTNVSFKRIKIPSRDLLACLNQLFNHNIFHHYVLPPCLSRDPASFLLHHRIESGCISVPDFGSKGFHFPNLICSTCLFVHTLSSNVPQGLISMCFLHLRSFLQHFFFLLRSIAPVSAPSHLLFRVTPCYYIFILHWSFPISACCESELRSATTSYSSVQIVSDTKYIISCSSY